MPTESIVISPMIPPATYVTFTIRQSFMFCINVPLLLTYDSSASPKWHVQNVPTAAMGLVGGKLVQQYKRSHELPMEKCFRHHPLVHLGMEVRLGFPIYQPTSHISIAHILNYISNWEEANGVMTDTHSRASILAGRTPPPTNFVKINVDGSYTNEGWAAIGGLIRDTSGYWTLGFNKHIGDGSAILTEVCSIFIGLQVAWKFGYNCVVVECDSLSTINFLSNNMQPTHPLHSLIGLCKETINRNWHCSIHHIYREANSAVHLLATNVNSNNWELQTLFNIPYYLEAAIV